VKKGRDSRCPSYVSTKKEKGGEGVSIMREKKQISKKEVFERIKEKVRATGIGEVAGSREREKNASMSAISISGKEETKRGLRVQSGRDGG